MGHGTVEIEGAMVVVGGVEVRGKLSCGRVIFNALSSSWSFFDKVP